MMSHGPYLNLDPVQDVINLLLVNVTHLTLCFVYLAGYMLTKLLGPEVPQTNEDVGCFYDDE